MTSHGPSFFARKRRPSSTSTFSRGSRGTAKYSYAAETTSGSSSTTSICMPGKSRQVALGRRASAEPDVEHLLRLPPVCDRKLEVVGVLEARLERIVHVHPALEGAVEAEIAAGVVLDDGDPVVLGVLGVDDLVAALRVLDRPDPVVRSLLAIHRRPVPQLRGGHGRTRLGGEREDGADARTGERERDRQRDRQPLDEGHSRRGEHQRDGGRSEHLVGAELRDQPERCRGTSRRSSPPSRLRRAGRRSGRGARASAPSGGRQPARPCRARRSGPRRGGSWRRAGSGVARDPSRRRGRASSRRRTGSRAPSAHPPRAGRRAAAAAASGRRARLRASSRSTGLRARRRSALPRRRASCRSEARARGSTRSRARAARRPR